MHRFMVAGMMTLVAGWVATGPAARGADDPMMVIDKAIAAMGGEAKLARATALQWKADGKLIIDGNDNSFTTQYMTQGLDHIRAELEGEFNGNEIKVKTVLDGNKGWRTFPEINALDPDGVANEKRNAYLQIVPITLVSLKDKAFKAEASPEEKVNEKPANVVKVTGPDGKSFKLMFDKETGLPVRMTATVVGFGGDDYDQVSTFSDYKDFGGIKKATKVEMTRDGNPFLNVTVKEFQVVEKHADDTFAEPKRPKD